MISRVVPISPSRGKIRVMLLMWASALRSVMASVARVTLKPCSCAWRAVELDADAGGDAGDGDLGDAEFFQVRSQPGVGEGAPGSLGERVIMRLGVQLRDEIGPAGGKFADADPLLRAARRAAGDIDEDDREVVAAERIGEGGGARHDRVGRVRGGQCYDALLQIDEDEGGFRVERGDGHGEFLAVMGVGAPVAREDLSRAKGGRGA